MNNSQRGIAHRVGAFFCVEQCLSLRRTLMKESLVIIVILDIRQKNKLLALRSQWGYFGHTWNLLLSTRTIVNTKYIISIIYQNYELCDLWPLYSAINVVVFLQKYANVHLLSKLTLSKILIFRSTILNDVIQLLSWSF